MISDGQILANVFLQIQLHSISKLYVAVLAIALYCSKYSSTRLVNMVQSVVKKNQPCVITYYYTANDLSNIGISLSINYI